MPAAYGARADGVHAAALASGGAMIVVNSLSDIAANDGRCTLREAITSANTNTASGAAAGECAAGTGDDTIVLSVTGTIDLASVLPDLTTNMTITGPGANLLTVQRGAAGGTPGFGIFNIQGGVTAALSGLTISGGSAVNIGGGISNSGRLSLRDLNVVGNSGDGIANLNGGSLSLTNCLVSGNSGDSGAGISNNSGTVNVVSSAVSNNSANGGFGAGIENTSGTVNIINSSVSGNTNSGGAGGGIMNNIGSTSAIVNSTVSGNTAGAGVYNNGTLTLANVTVSGNTATVNRNDGGGGIDNGGTLTLTNVTVSGNAAAGGGGGIFGGNVTNLSNTVVAGNSVSAGSVGPDLQGTFNSLDYNLIGDTSGATIGGDTSHSILNRSANLGPLAENGGPTKTMLPLPGSPAINAGSVSNLPPDTFDLNKNGNTAEPLLVDQRGLLRLVNAAVDIGAVEVNYALSATAGTPQSVPINTAFAAQMKVAVTESGRTVGNASVTFTAPATGASGAFQGTGTNVAAVNTDGGGIATASVFTANGKAGGPYNVVASVGAGPPTVNFSLTNLKGDQTIAFGPLADRTYGDAQFQLSATASSGLTVIFEASGPCVVINSTVLIAGAGSCTITASQPGDANYKPAPRVQQSFQIAKAATATDVFSSANPSGASQSVDFSADVTPAAPGPATGTVTFKDNGSAISGCAGVALNTGHATCTTNALSLGSHTITADYSGDSNFNASTGTLQGGQTVTVGGVFNFSQATYTVGERDGSVTITVERTGDNTQAASVDYATDDGSTPTVAVPCSSVTGIALERCDYTRAAGTLQFAAGEAQKTLAVLVNDDSYAEGTETLTLRLSNPAGGTLGQQSLSTLQITDDARQTSNPVDGAQFFVRQHYHDFLSREPDAAGLQFWTSGITSCGGSQGCVDVKRVNTSAAFFLSIEFRETGYLVERIYKTAFGDAAGNSTFPAPHRLAVPVVRLDEFHLDTQRIGRGGVVGQGDWQRQLEDNKNAFALEFVSRQRFQNAGLLSDAPAQYVDRLNLNAGVVLTQTQRDQLVSQLAADDTPAARASVLRQVAENPALDAAERNRAFVLMQFFGYLRRNPNDAPDSDYTSYDFWSQKLDQFNGDFVQAEMVKAFITSTEYRQRFGQP
jgi:CSLREA domain-containing protein